MGFRVFTFKPRKKYAVNSYSYTEIIVTNPLQKYFRQPKIYVRLPSSGNFYPPGAIEMTETGEFPVFAMTAKDELMFKTPDALLNGQSTVDVIQSCVPNIKNAWAMPSIDVDAVLVAIRIATYGENMEIRVDIPNTEITKDYEVDLRHVLDSLSQSSFEPILEINDDIVLQIRPLTYRETTINTTRTLEEQRIFTIVNDEEMSDEDKIAVFNQSFRRLTDLTVGTVSQAIAAIKTPDGIIQEREVIDELINSCDASLFKKVVSHLEEQRERFNIKPFTVHATPEEIEDGAPESFEVPVNLDASVFFK